MWICYEAATCSAETCDVIVKMEKAKHSRSRCGSQVKDIPYKVPVQYVISAHSLPPHLASGALSLLLSAARLLCADTTASCFESAGHTHSRPPSSSELTTGSRVLDHCPPCPHIKGIGSQRLAANVSSTANCGTSSQASCVASSSLSSAVSTHR